MKTIKLLIVSLLSASSVFAQTEEKSFFQKYPFVNMTEFGLLLGRVNEPIYYGPYDYSSSIVPTTNYAPPRTVTSLSLQTFNGVYLHPKTAVGITTGLDLYSNVLILPLAAGVRQTLFQKKNDGSSIYAGIDAGYGTTWLQGDGDYIKYQGGLTTNPTLGFRLPMRNRSAILLNFGYKFQELSITQHNPYDEVYSSVETRKYHRFSIRTGLEF